MDTVYLCRPACRRCAFAQQALPPLHYRYITVTLPLHGAQQALPPLPRRARVQPSRAVRWRRPLVALAAAPRHCHCRAGASRRLAVRLAVRRAARGVAELVPHMYIYIHSGLLPCTLQFDSKNTPMFLSLDHTRVRIHATMCVYESNLLCRYHLFLPRWLSHGDQLLLEFSDDLFGAAAGSPSYHPLGSRVT